MRHALEFTLQAAVCQPEENSRLSPEAKPITYEPNMRQRQELLDPASSRIPA